MVSQTFVGNSHAGVIEVDNIEGDRSACTVFNALISLETASLRGSCTLSSGTFTSPSIVTFAPEFTNSTITLTNSSINVGSDFTVEIQGSGITFNAASPGFRAFNVISGGSLTMSSFNINGGGIYIQGNSNVALSDCHISASQYGGVVSFYSELNVNNCVISDNVDNVGAGFYILGGNATLSNTTIDSNTGIFGGGIHIDNNATVSILSTTISNNTARSGGGIDVLDGSIVNISNSTISGNSSNQVGGAININTGSLQLINTTISNNTSPASQASVHLNQSNSSITSMSLVNSIIANSIGGEDCQISNNSTATSDNNSIIEDGSCNTQAQSIAPLLGLLSDNGGPTLTHSLLTNSPAINTGDNSNCPTTDQRGETRANIPTNPCDVGSFEVIDNNDDSLFVIPLGNNKTVIIEL